MKGESAIRIRKRAGKKVRKACRFLELVDTVLMTTRFQIPTRLRVVSELGCRVPQPG